MEIICSWPENPSQKLETRFTEKFSVNHFPKHFTSLLSLFALFLLSFSALSLYLAQRASVLPEPPPVLCLPRRNPPPLLSFSHRPPHPLGLVISLVQEQIYNPRGLAVVTTSVVLRWWRWVVGHWASRRSQADLVTRLRGGLRRSLSRLTVWWFVGFDLFVLVCS